MKLRLEIEGGRNTKKTKKKPRVVLKKEQETLTDSKHTQVTLCAESEFAENVEEYLDVITPRKIHHFKF